MLGVVLGAEGRELPKGTPWVTLPICTSKSLCLHGGGEGGPRLSMCVVRLGVCMQRGGSLRISGRRVRVSVGPILVRERCFCVFGLGVYCVCMSVWLAGSCGPRLWEYPKWQ